VRLIKELSGYQEVSVCVIPSLYTSIRQMIDEWENEQSSESSSRRYKISLIEMEYDDCWFRDSAPTFIIHPFTREVRAIDWNFNGWGNQFEHSKDISIARKVIEIAGVERYKCPLVMEGGSFHTDGEGTLITTEECLLNPNRNPQCSKGDIESLLKEYLGVRKVIWIKEGVYGDTDTSGHVDNLCCFIRANEIALTFPDDVTSPQYPRSLAALELLQSQTDAMGRQLIVHKIIHPSPSLYRSDEDRFSLEKVKEDDPDRSELLVASYINFYIGNQVVIMPGFGIDTDQIAFQQLVHLFPSHRVIQIPAREILFGGGNIHCITQQHPSSSFH